MGVSMNNEKQSGAKNLKECDLVMKGGLTSGVVYPETIIELSKTYRLRNIGGTSAGAIAMVIAAAAEYRRQMNPGKNSNEGFKAIRKLSEDLAANLRSFFQPTEKLRPLFEYLLSTLEDSKKPKSQQKKWWQIILPHYGFVLRGLKWRALLDAGCFSFVAGYFMWEHQYKNVAITVLCAALLAIIGLAVGVSKVCGRINEDIATNLPDNHFGVCTGLSQDPAKPAITDWMAAQIDRIAFGATRPIGSKPLLVSDLKKAGINIAAMTTDLSSRRPYQLPFSRSEHYFKESEFRDFLPKYIVDYLVEQGEQYNQNKYQKTINGDSNPISYEAFLRTIIYPKHPKGYYNLAVGGAMPVLLVVRLSLSFPGLFSAMPLYRVDYTLNNSSDNPQQKLCLFSDGGISSNFPVHFFDSILPRRPTFGISMGTHYIARTDDINKRVFFPFKTRYGGLPPVYDIGGLTNFFSSIVNTAKDWQDNLQSELPGNYDRIVEIRLDENEGGLNLDMPPHITHNLIRYGKEAGVKLTTKFDGTKHRYYRMVSALPSLEKTVMNFHTVFNSSKWAGIDDVTWPYIITDYDANIHKPKKEWRKDPLLKFADDISLIGSIALKRKDAKNLLAISEYELSSTGKKNKLPFINAGLRIIASPDFKRRPK